MLREPPDRLQRMQGRDGVIWYGELVWSRRLTVGRLLFEFVTPLLWPRPWPADEPGDITWSTRYWPTSGRKTVLTSPYFDHEADARVWRNEVAADLSGDAVPRGEPYVPPPDLLERILEALRGLRG